MIALLTHIFCKIVSFPNAKIVIFLLNQSLMFEKNVNVQHFLMKNRMYFARNYEEL